MVILVRLFGAAIIVMGIIFSVNKEAFKQYISYWRQKKSLKIGALISIICGVIFLVAAPRCRLDGLITVLGVWAVIKGVLLLVIKQKKILDYLDWWQKRPISVMRILAGIVLAFGALLVYSA